MRERSHRVATEQKAQADFDAHWNAHAVAEISPSKQAEANGFLRPLKKRMKQATQPMYVLDVGCGNGVHAVALLQDDLGSHRYSGVDISAAAVRLACEQSRKYATCAAQVDFQVGNVLALPYNTYSFDAVFSYGVITYTGAPLAALDEMVRVCKPGGLIGIWVYPKQRGIGGSLFELTRAICRRLGHRWSKIIVYAVVLALPILPTRSGVNLLNASLQQCVEVVEVNLLPEVLDFLTTEEILSWFHKRNLYIEQIDSERPIAVWARV